MFNNIKQLLSKKELLVVLVIAAACLPVVLLIFAYSNPKTTTQIKGSLTPTPLPSTARPVIDKDPNFTSKNMSIRFSFQDINLPKTMPIYSLLYSPIDESFESSLSSTLIPSASKESFKTPNGIVDRFSNSSQNLYFYTSSFSVEYSSSLNPISTPVQNASEVINAATSFLEENNLYTNNLIPAHSGPAGYISTGSDLIPSESFLESDVFDVIFEKKVGGFRVYSQFGSSAALHVWVTKYKNVAKMTYKNPYTESVLLQATTRSFSEIKKDIQNNKGIVAQIGDGYQEAIESVVSAELSNAELGYLRDDRVKILYPIIVFTGNATTNTGDILPITIFIAAY